MGKSKYGAMKPKSVVVRGLWGLFFLAAAALVLLMAFDVVSIGVNVGTMVGLVALTAVAILFVTKKFWLGACMVIAAGLMVASSAGLLMDFSGQQRGMIFVAAALVGVALHIMFRSKLVEITTGEDGEFEVNGGDGNEVNVDFTGVTKNIMDKEFTSAALRCNFGAIKAHFEGAKLKGGKATIVIENHFSGVELFLPKNWAVDNQLDMVAGGVEEKNRPMLDEKSPRVVLVGNLRFGGVVITYV